MKVESTKYNIEIVENDEYDENYEVCVQPKTDDSDAIVQCEAWLDEANLSPDVFDGWEDTSTKPTTFRVFYPRSTTAVDELAESVKSKFC